jgi:hypothetical protein
MRMKKGSVMNERRREGRRRVEKSGVSFFYFFSLPGSHVKVCHLAMGTRHGNDEKIMARTEQRGASNQSQSRRETEIEGQKVEISRSTHTHIAGNPFLFVIVHGHIFT